MSEQLPLSEPVIHTSPAKPSKAGLVLGGLALLIAVAAAGATGWIIYRLSPQLNSMAEQQQTLTNQQQSQVSFFQNKLDELQQSTQQQLSSISSAVDEKLLAQQTQQQTDLAALKQQVEQQSGNTKGWKLLEIEYFLKLAEQKLFLEQDVPAVQQILEMAEQRLKDADDPSLTPVREAINKDKLMLGALNAPDLNQLHLTLSNLRAQSLMLPLRQSETAISTEEDEVSEDPADWRSNLGLYWHKFWSNFVHVRASLPEDGVSLTAEQQISVRNTLTQQLLLAELAAMQHNQAVYAAAIQQSADSLQRYFAATEPAVQQMADELVVLSAMQVSLPLLAPLQSPESFRAYRQGVVAEPAL
ncbi:MAG TPA: hypothetical protein DCS87_12175 [Rheinheimera sp.]|nr:hypothetical protein [Rheinheimera sp.]